LTFLLLLVAAVVENSRQAVVARADFVQQLRQLVVVVRLKLSLI
jgi:hypothetical protein